MNDLVQQLEQQERAAEEKYQQALSYLKILAVDRDFSPEGDREFEAARTVCLAARIKYFNVQIRRFFVEEAE